MTVVKKEARVAGLDLARALSIFGMIVVNYKIAMMADGSGPSWLAAFAGLFEGRASAVFVVLAGIGISLMTRKARRGDESELAKQKLVIRKRSVYLLALGLFLLAAGWTADILHYYALFLFAASFLIRSSGRFLAGTAAAAVLAGQCAQLLFDYGAGWDASFHAYTDFWSAGGFFRNLFFNGFHPALPWFAFFVTGMLIGRLDLTDSSKRFKRMTASLILLAGSELISGLAMKLSAASIGDEGARYLFETKPMPPNLLYMVSAASSAMLVILFCNCVMEKMPGQRTLTALVHTGQMALSHYVLHVIAGLGLLEALGVLENGSLPFSVAYSVGYFAAAVGMSLLWKRKFSRGPLEALMRKL
ncbi:DUF418 domain-containing protein [Paenibacillus sp. UNC499MF]|uniref:DUF418 domain-containing protein n=1 Tax=Paenibacillus sp. UNC499MF TaxID=1502751 RepID=UPI00089FA3E1|nr:DUF418 domain-containing protein [Paenibacillus sp. UNC499MF]SEF45971.1 Uncharacterized membrane protein YeiB [Paenibacillus sp. UNC499MF]